MKLGVVVVLVILVSSATAVDWDFWKYFQAENSQSCNICKDTVSMLQGMARNYTDDDVKKIAYDVCHTVAFIPPEMVDQCYNGVVNNMASIREALTGKDAQVICSEWTMCTTSWSFGNIFKLKAVGTACDACKNVFSNLKTIVRKYPDMDTIQFAKDVCNRMQNVESKNQCLEYVDQWATLAINIIKNSSDAKTCGMLRLCAAEEPMPFEGRRVGGGKTVINVRKF